ncbi:MAG: peptide chain release factor-like protein [Planctomycetes bacterium]|nr:peptide chain release factor-like protein [Planctomycetota bacterium]
MNPARSPHPAALDDEELLGQCSLGRGRSSGPGGQHRNKVETKITIQHTPTGISAQAGERRSQGENKRVAVFRLRTALAVGRRCPVPMGDANSDLWRSRVRSGRIAVNQTHRDFPAMLAEAMDMLADCRHDHKQAANRLQCTPSQLVKLFKKHPPAMERVNRDRAELGLTALR